MLQGFIIGYAKAPLPDILEQIAAFLPKINNWSVCDSFCITLKAAGENPAEFWDFLQPCILSGEEFTVRFCHSDAPGLLYYAGIYRQAVPHFRRYQP